MMFGWVGVALITVMSLKIDRGGMKILLTDIRSQHLHKKKNYTNSETHTVYYENVCLENYLHVAYYRLFI